MNRIAWSPFKNPHALFLTSIVCSEKHQMDVGLYLAFLGDRVQALVDDCEDPAEAASSFQEQFVRGALAFDAGYCSVDEIGERLVACNPAVRMRLEYLGLSHVLADVTRAPATDDLLARRALLANQDCPDDALISWACQLVQVMDLFDPENTGDSDC